MTEPLPHLTDDALRTARRGLCPDCTSLALLVDGPRGGLSINRHCTACGARFNFLGPYGELGVERIAGARPRRFLLAVIGELRFAEVAVTAAFGADGRAMLLMTVDRPVVFGELDPVTATDIVPVLQLYNGKWIELVTGSSVAFAEVLPEEQINAQ